MMKKIIRRIVVGLGLLAGLVVLLHAVVYGLSASRLDRTYDIADEQLVIGNDQAIVERGRYLTTAVVGCRDCHGGDLGGAAFMVDPAIGAVYGSNLTGGAGGIGALYSDADWVRAIRHGVGPDGEALLAIPAGEYMNLGEADLAAIIAYLQSLPPVDRTMPGSQMGPVGRALLLAGVFPPPAAEGLDHQRPFPAEVPPGPTAAYGQYLVSLGCAGCHREDMSGGDIPGVPPDWPAAPSLAAGSTISGWSEAEFMRAMRTGNMPDNQTMDPTFMPWPVFANMTDADLQAIWAYLTSLGDVTASAE
jgi:mono/diheme cytochrome c family protein